LEVIGRDNYGVLSIQGKLINATNPRSSVFGNKEVIRLCHALGLDANKDYADGDISSLRYGHILIMTDQDPDGSHIKGLLINFLNRYWPRLLTIDSFCQQLITPLVKVTGIGLDGQKKGKMSTVSFYSEQEYEDWRMKVIQSKGSQGLKNFFVKYYKVKIPLLSPSHCLSLLDLSVQGLGTSTSAEGRDYFRNLELHVKNFVFGEDTIGALDLAFSSARTEDRKVWLKNYSRSSARIPPTQRDILYEDFINKDLINYSYTDLKRSIPSLFDGLKISQRKILFTCFKENVRKETKVGQLSGLTTDVAAYHHGEASLHNSIIKMAQDFVGSNNIPLLEPCGQFGTRHYGGEDSASPRYIFTRLAPIADLIFPEPDMHILSYETEDGKQVEPSFFLPIIPMILVNGSRGIGTGWSTNVLNYNPLDVSESLIRKIR
jgi:DNA topoisomerase II